jgi:hypothetical protein
MTESHWERVEHLKTLFFKKLDTEKDDGTGSALTKLKHGMDQWIAFEKRVERIRGVRRDGEVTMLFTFLLLGTEISQTCGREYSFTGLGRYSRVRKKALTWKLLR